MNKYDFIVNGDLVSIQSETRSLLLVDALNYIVFERTDKRGRLMLQINGMPAKLTDEIKTGDKIVINWIMDV